MHEGELEIEIAPDGKVTIRTIGIKGPACVDIAQALARIVGEETERTLTGEYYEADVHIRSETNLRQHYE